MDKIRNALFIALVVNVMSAAANGWAIGSRIAVGINAAAVLVLVVAKLIRGGSGD